MYLFNVWFIMIYFFYSKILKINTKTDDKVALNKAKLKGLNIKREISCILKNILYLWQRNDRSGARRLLPSQGPEALPTEAGGQSCGYITQHVKGRYQ